MLKRTVVVLLSVLSFATANAAQEQQGAIEGTVRDNTGAVLPGAVVEARSSAGGMLTATSDASGLFRFPAVQVGTYSVTASLQGFTPRKIENVNVRLGQTLTLEFGLTVGGVSESVQVLSEAPLIDVRSNAASATVTRDVIEAMPSGRDFTSLIKLTPGAGAEPKSGGIQVDGASGSENRYYIDGVDTTNLQNGTSGKNLVVDFLEEVQVKSSGYNAEFRGATGGVINVVTKSGTNTYRGSAGTEFQSRGMEGRERPTLRLVLSGANAAEVITNREEGDSTWFPLVEAGGPVFRDRLWFYGGFSGTYRDRNRTVTFNSDQSTATFNQTTRTTFLTGNVNGQVTKDLRAKFSTTLNPVKTRGSLPSVNGTDNPAVDFASQGSDQPNTSLTGQVDYVASPRLFLSGRINGLSYDQHQIGIPNELWYTFSGSPGTFPEVPASLVRAAGFNSTRTNRAIVRDKFTRFMAQTDATFFASAAGQHTVKAGLLYERVANDVLDAEQAPHMTLNWGASYTTPDGADHRGPYGYYSIRQVGTIGAIQTNNVGLFIQDGWTIKNRLTLNLGLRTEQETVPSYAPGLLEIKFGFADKLAPRVGAAYDVKGDGKWKVYGSWGLYYDLFKLEMPRGLFGADKFVENYYTLDTFDWPSIGPNNNFPGRFIESVDFRSPSNDPACPECGAIDPDLRPMRLQEFTAGLDHELSPTLSLGVRYIHKQIDRAVEDLGVLTEFADGSSAEVYTIGNPGVGVGADLDGPLFPNMPKARRDYDAIEARLTKRFNTRWRADVIYRLSRLYGNYPGLSSSDEVNAAGEGRNAPNSNRLFDALQMAFDQTGQPVLGRLETDRPHELKLSGSYAFPFGTSIAVFQQVSSGTPVTRQVSVVGTPMFYLGRGSDGRLPVFAQTDLRVAQDVRLGSRRVANFFVEVLNLFDADTSISRFMSEARDRVVFRPRQTLFDGFDMQAKIAATANIRRDPRFLMDQAFQARRVARLGVKLTF